MELRQKLMADLKSAMLSKQQDKVDTIRFLQSAIKYKEVELRPGQITNDDVLGVVKKLVKQRKESIDQFQAAGRDDLVTKETNELRILEEYLPKQLSREETQKVVEKVIQDVGAKTIKDMGSVMKEVIARTQGAADNKIVSELIKSKLS